MFIYVKKMKITQHTYCAINNWQIHGKRAGRIYSKPRVVVTFRVGDEGRSRVFTKPVISFLYVEHIIICYLS